MDFPSVFSLLKIYGYTVYSSATLTWNIFEVITYSEYKNFSKNTLEAFFFLRFAENPSFV